MENIGEDGDEDDRTGGIKELLLNIYIYCVFFTALVSSEKCTGK